MDLTLLESKLDELDAEAARMAVATGKDGAGLQTSELDELSKVANADFLIEVGIFPHAYGPRKRGCRAAGQDGSFSEYADHTERVGQQLRHYA